MVFLTETLSKSQCSHGHMWKINKMKGYSIVNLVSKRQKNIHRYKKTNSETLTKLDHQYSPKKTYVNCELIYLCFNITGSNQTDYKTIDNSC